MQGVALENFGQVVESGSSQVRSGLAALGGFDLGGSNAAAAVVAYCGREVDRRDTERGVAAALGPELLTRMQAEAPGVTVRFLGESAADVSRLRDGDVDLQVGVFEDMSPDVRVEPLADLQMMLAVRSGHPLTLGRLTPERIAAAVHVSASRRGLAAGPLDTALTAYGLRRPVVAVVPDYTEAMLVVARTDLVGLLPGRSVSWVPGVELLQPPVELPTVTVSQAWHRRHDNDGAHRWLRGCVSELIRALR